MTENIKPCGRLDDKWKWKEGSEFDDKSVLPYAGSIYRNYFDCGMYFFDGVFNVVKFPKDMILYHGSGILADNLAGFPVGIPYYNPETPNIPVPSPVVVASSDESIEAIITENFPITAGWYADPRTARTYSSQSIDNLCGDRCVYAYKVTRDIVLFLLDDDYNIGKLFNSEESLVPNEVKENLAFMFDLGSLQKVPTRFNTVQFTKKARRSDRRYDLPFANWACTNIIKALGYSGYCANKQITEYHGGLFHQEFVFCNAFKWLERDVTNTHDWQYNPVLQNVTGDIKVYLDQLNLYECTNINFHSGNLLEHSVWSLLWAEYILEGRDEFKDFAINIGDEFKRAIAFAAFIHDIGKMEPENHRENNIYNEKRDKYIYFDVPNHPRYGFDYIMKTSNFPVYSNNEIVSHIDIDNLFNQFGVNLKYKNLIADIILLHWGFGNSLKRLNANPGDLNQILSEYSESFYETISPHVNNSVDFRFGIYALIVVSMSDILATQPYGMNRITKTRPSPDNINKRSTNFPFISNITKNYKGINLPRISNLKTTGIRLASDLITNSEGFYNHKKGIK